MKSFAISFAVMVALSQTYVDGDMEQGEIDAEFIENSRVQFSMESGIERDATTGEARMTPALLFTCTKERPGAMYCVDPSILILEDEGWRRVGRVFPSHDWVWTGASHDGKHVWGIVDAITGGRGPNLIIVMSDDHGRTWSTPQVLRKPTYMSYFHDFRMDDEGNGALIIYYADNIAGPDSGYYSYSTSDWGQTWTDKFEYEPSFVRHPYKASQHEERFSLQNRMTREQKNYESMKAKQVDRNE